MNLTLLALIFAGSPRADVRPPQQASCGRVCIEWLAMGADEGVQANRHGCERRAKGSPLQEGQVRLSTPEGESMIAELGSAAGLDDVFAAICSPDQTMLALPARGKTPLQLVRVENFPAFARGTRDADAVVPLICELVVPLGWISPTEFRFVFGCGHGAALGQVDVRSPAKVWMWLRGSPPARPDAPSTSGATLFERDPLRPELPLNAPEARGARARAHEPARSGVSSRENDGGH